MIFHINIGILAGFWLISMTFSALAIWWSVFAGAVCASMHSLEESEIIPSGPTNQMQRTRR
jgi:hypothetical protein